MQRLLDNPFAGIQIFVSNMACEPSDERLFPESRHRSKRILKKLIKRHGGIFRMKPVMFQTPQGLIVHPALYQTLIDALARREKEAEFVTKRTAENPEGRSMMDTKFGYYGLMTSKFRI